MHALEAITESLKDEPDFRDKVLKKSIKQFFYFGNLPFIEDTLKIVSKHKILKDIFNKTILCNPKKRRHILWHIVEKSNLTNMFYFDSLVECLIKSCTIWDLINMFENESKKYFYNTSNCNVMSQLIIDRTHYIDYKIIRLIYFGITLFNKIDKNNRITENARNILKKTIDTLCYFNIVCIKEEGHFRKKQLNYNYQFINSNENNESEDIQTILQDIEFENKYLIYRNTHLNKIKIYFDMPILTQYVSENLLKTNSYFFNRLFIHYLHNWNVLFKSEKQILKFIKNLINKSEYFQEIICSLNNVILKKKFIKTVEHCQEAIENLVTKQTFITINVINFINNFNIDLTNRPKVIYLLLDKIANTQLRHITSYSKFLLETHKKMDVLCYELRNIFLKCVFKILKLKQNLENINVILIDICLKNRSKLINYFAHEHDIFDDELWTYFISCLKNINYNIYCLIEDIPIQIKKNLKELNEKKGLCLDEITATIIEEPIVIPPKSVVDKYTIYPYILIENMNPFNRQPLNINDLEELNSNSQLLENFKKEHDYKKK